MTGSDLEPATAGRSSVDTFVRGVLDGTDDYAVAKVCAALYRPDVGEHLRLAGALGELAVGDPAFGSRVRSGELGPAAVAAMCADRVASAVLLRDKVKRVFAHTLQGAPGFSGSSSGLEVLLEAAVHRRFGRAPADYYRAARLLAGVVARPRGACLETCLGAEVAAGALGVGDLLDLVWERGEPYRKAAAPPDERSQVRALFYRMLDGFGEERAPYASELERGCYNEVLKECALEAVKCQWDVPKFRNLYSARCGRLAAHLDSEGSVARSVGGAPVYNQLKSGTWRPDVVGALDNDDLCTVAHRAVKDTIRKRQQQKVVRRRENLFECPMCHVRDCEWTLVQTRALDEPATIFCTCVCGHRFRGH